MLSAKSICLAIVVVIISVFVAFHRSFIVNPLTLTATDLTGKTVVVTGASEGIGKETAAVLASWGARLILPVREEGKGLQVKQEILQELGRASDDDGAIRVEGGVDFADFSTVRAFAEKVRGERIDMLINNAGVVMGRVEKTVDGNELAFQVNHLSPFLLTYLLLPSLRLSQDPRVVFVSSFNHYMGSVGPSRYSTAERGLGVTLPNSRYDDSKLMNVMTAMSFHERFFEKDGIAFNSLHPGYVVSRIDGNGNLPVVVETVLQFARKRLARSTRQGAVTQITVATHPKLAKVSGRYFSDHCINQLCKAPCPYCDQKNAPGVIPSAKAQDKATRDWLWETSCEIIGIKA